MLFSAFNVPVFILPRYRSDVNMDSPEFSLVKLSVFLSAAYILGHLFRLANTSPILGHILTGAILGPGLLSFAPIPAGLSLAGLLGIQLWVLDAGMCTNLSTLQRLAPRALLIAVLGILLPLGGAVGAISATHAIERSFEVNQTLRVGFAAGAALAPTSLGVTAALLAEHNELDSELGRLISIAAVFDDVISLVLLAEVQAAAAGTITAWRMLRPVVFSLVFIIGAGLAAYFLPRGLEAVLPRAPINEDAKWRLGLAFVFATAILATYAAVAASTSFLLAGYLVGVAFADASDRDFRKPWADHARVHVDWLVLLFFAATIGFVVPLRALFKPSALALGAVLAIIATVGKLLCGIGARNRTDAVAVGVAMLGRGEFGFLIAASARQSGLLSERIYCATIWGVLVPTLLTPVLFGFVFRWRGRKLYDETEFSHDGSSSLGDRPSPGPVSMDLRVPA